MSDLRLMLTSAGFAIIFCISMTAAFVGLPAFAGTDSEVKIRSVDESGIEKPVRIQGAGPAYPEVSREEKIEGTVVVRTVIDTSGWIQMQDTEVLSSIGPAFEQAVLATLPEWRFQPATLQGNPVPVYYHLTFNFKIAEEQTADER